MSEEGDKITLQQVLEGIFSGYISQAALTPTPQEYAEWTLGNRGKAVSMLRARLARRL